VRVSKSNRRTSNTKDESNSDTGLVPSKELSRIAIRRWVQESSVALVGLEWGVLFVGVGTVKMGIRPSPTNSTNDLGL